MAKGGFTLKDLMNEQSIGTKGRKGAGLDLRHIPIEKIRLSAANKYSIQKVEELAANIETFGLMHNLLVRPAGPDGMHELVSGHRRYCACCLLHEGDPAQFATIPCMVSEAGSDTVAELMLIFANATTRELTDYEKTYQSGRLKELLTQAKAEGYKFKGRMRDQIADMLKVSPAQVGRMESINEHLAEDLKGAFQQGDIGITTAYDASTLPPEQQAKAVREYREKGPEAVKAAVQEAKQCSPKPSPGRADCEKAAAALNRDKKDKPDTLPAMLREAAEDLENYGRSDRHDVVKLMRDAAAALE